jgi:hypothetical protein
LAVAIAARLGGFRDRGDGLDVQAVDRSHGVTPVSIPTFIPTMP